jgi:serine/threonine-protein kinase
MRSEEWQQVNQLFHSALAREPSERAAFLDEACGDDDSLHKRVEVLLAAHDNAGSFIERPAIEVEARSVANHQNELAAGQTLGHYRILSQLGKGGMGEVYLAEDVRLDRKVALKILPTDVAANQERMRRFIQEAKAASALNHPNIVTIHEIDHANSIYFIATEFIEGETLRERMRRESLKLGEVLDVASQISSALAAAHDAGIVHRDIKPENIMLRCDGIVKVLDFGLAKLTARVPLASVDTEATTAINTEPGVVMGTASYMSPEQARGLQVDGRTDIFSLGVVIYEMVAGCLPFEGSNTYEILASVLSDKQTPPLTRVATEAPEELDRIVTKALRKDREERYQTTKDLLIDLRSLKHHVEFEEELEHSAAPHDEVEDAVGSSSNFGPQLTITAEHLVSGIKQHKRAVIIGLCALILAVAGVAYFFYFARTAQAIDSIAVLPLVNASNDPNTEYLSDGISEALINSLTELRELRVPARTTTFRYKGKDVDPQALGRELDVRAVLMGRVRQIGDTLSIQVDLVDTATGAQLWGREYQRKVSDLLSVKQLIAREVTQKLRLGLSGEQQQKLSKGDTTNAEAYEFYLRGRYYWNKRTVDDLSKAIEQFQHAIDKDPNYALAYVGLTDSYTSHALYANTPTREMLPRAREAVERALQIDDSLAEAHAALGQIERDSWNFSEAEREYKRAIELNPRYATAHHFYSLFLRAWRGRYDEAMVEIKLAQQLDPLSPIIGSNLAASYMSKGELEAAIEAAKRVIELEPSFNEAHRQLALAYRKQRRYDEAIAEGEKAVQLSGRQGWSLAVLGVSYAVGGHTDKAREILKELEERYAQHTARGQQIAYVCAVLGEKDQAFAWLDKDYQVRSGPLPFIAYAEENTLRDALSGDPRWNDLLKRMGLLQ